MIYKYPIAFGLLIVSVFMSSCQSSAPSSQAAATASDSTRSTTAGIDTITTKTDTMATTADTTPAAPKPLTVIIENLGSETAPVEVSIYSPDNKFPSSKDQMKIFRFTPSGPTLTATLPGIKHGSYAIATYQDMDGDGKIATNMIGVPTDPYGFSNNYKPKIKAPSFKDCKFDYDDNTNTVSIKMIRSSK